MTFFFTLVNIFLIALMSRWAWKRLGSTDGIVYWLALVAHLTAGIAVGLFYKYYYHGLGDTFALFDDAVKVTKGHFNFVTTEPRSRFFVFILGAVNVVTHNNYWLSSMWLSLFSFLCSYRLVLKLDENFPSLQLASRIALLFIPSIVFWSSGIIKETLVVGAVCILAMYFIGFMRNEKLNGRSIMEIILALILLLGLKYYWGAVLIPTIIAAIIIKKTDPKKFVFGWFMLAFLVLALAASATHPNFHLDRFLTVIVENHNSYLYSDNLIEYYSLTPSWYSLFINSPLALWSGLFRPTVFEISSWPHAFAAIENLVILILLIWKIKFIRMPKPENRLIVFTVILYTIVLCVFLALSTPNLGTLSRYRVGFLSFFILLILADHPILKFINGKSSNHIRS